MNQTPLFIENNCKYLIEYRGKEGEVWRACDKWMTQNYAILPDDKVQIIERIGTPKEVFK